MELDIKSNVSITATLTLTEPDLRALEAITAYGIDNFLKVFYAELGTSYTKPYEKNIRTLFETIRSQVPNAINQVDITRKALLSEDGYRVMKGGKYD